MNPLNELDPSIRALALAFMADAKAQGIDLAITEGYRSNQRQDQLYAQGRTAPGQRVTNARAGQSIHNHRMAFDVLPAIVKNKKNWDPSNPAWQQVGALAKKHGFEWGGNWKMRDMPHIQARGAKWQDLQKRGGGAAPRVAPTPATTPQQSSPQRIMSPVMMSKEPIAQQFAPTRAPSMPFGDIVAPQIVQTTPAQQFGDYLTSVQTARAEQKAAEQARLAALFGDNIFGVFG